MTIHAVLIDLDGTLVDSIPDLAHAANAMRLELGMHTLGQDVIASFVGKGIDNLIIRTINASLDNKELPPEVFNQAREIFVRHYHLVNGDGSTVYPGVIDGLKAMTAQGLKLAVVTNKAEAFTLPLLTQTGLIGFFDTVVSGDTCARKKPHPEPLLYACEKLGHPPEHSVFIGDSINDVQAAQAAGMPVLILPYGYNEGNSVQTLKVDAIIDSMTGAAQWLANQ
ncbi:MAG: phosphoglycolate phosphatase [Alcaligenaceae bacterium]|nr:phosphoglycolate phosphatase [Alcaligenaceae bacterium]